MDWDDLRYVLAVARHGSLTAAAASLGVARTTVGRRITTVETTLRVKLFDRTPDGFVLTSAAAELVQTGERVEAEILQTERRVLGRDAELEGPLRVATLLTLFDGFADVFAAFLERHPGIELTVCAGPEVVSLSRRDADVALRLGNKPSPHLVGRRVGRVTFATYAARGLAERLGPRAGWADYPWLHHDARSNTAWMDRWLASNAPRARIVLRSDEHAVLRAAVARGIGVHLLPCFDGDADPELVRVGTPVAEAAQDLWVLTVPDLRHNGRVRAFMDHVAAALRQT